MEYYVLASGSKGNCSIIRTKKTTIMLDCGLTKHRLNAALQANNLTLDMVAAVLITHSHSDHINGIRFVSELPIYSPCPIKSIVGEITVIPYESFSIGDIKITPLKLSHDAPETVGYIFKADEELVYITDTGYVSEQNLKLIQDANYYIIEANHDVEMLMNTNRPAMLKARILSDSGHLNNEQCGEIIAHVIGKDTKEVILAHLSQEANTPGIALETVKNTMYSCGTPLLDLKIKAADQVIPIHGGSL